MTCILHVPGVNCPGSLILAVDPDFCRLTPQTVGEFISPDIMFLTASCGSRQIVMLKKPSIYLVIRKVLNNLDLNFRKEGLMFTWC